MKIKNISKIILIILLFIETRFLLFIPSNGLNSNINKTFLVILSILFLFLLMKQILKENYLWQKTILIFLFLVLLEIIISSVFYNQSLNETLKVSLYNFILIFYFVLFYFKDNNNSKFLINSIVYFTLIVSILLIIQVYLYNKYAIKFLSVNTSNLRFNGLRIYDLGNFIEFGAVLSIGMYLNNKGKLIYLITFILGILEMVYVAKGRIGLIIVILSSLLMVVYYSKINIKKLSKYLFIILVVLVLVSNMSMLKEFTNSFGSSEFKAGDSLRKYEVEYYINQLKIRPIFGLGFAYFNSEYDRNYNFVRGNYIYKFYKDDVGIVGFTNTFGVLGFIWYIYLLYRFIKILIKVRKNNLLRENIYALGIVLLIIFQSFNTIIMDPQRIINLIFLLIILENLNNTYERSLIK